MPTRSDEALDTLVGTAKSTVRDFRVEAGKVEEFARAIHNDDPVYRDESVARERGHPAIPAPPTFLRTTYFPRYRAKDAPVRDGGAYFGFDVGFSPTDTVHGEQEYEFERPLYVGDVLDGTTTLADLSQSEGSSGQLTFAVFETEYTNKEGRLIATERTTFIEILDPEA